MLTRRCFALGPTLILSVPLGAANAVDNKYGTFIFVKPGQLDLGQAAGAGTPPEFSGNGRSATSPAVLDGAKTCPHAGAQVERAVADNASRSIALLMW